MSIPPPGSSPSAAGTSARHDHAVKFYDTVAHEFGLQVTAEHVEDAATVKILRRLGVDHGQGYHLGRPVPIPDPQTASPNAPSPARRRHERA